MKPALQSSIKIKTERLLLREMTMNDVDGLLPVLGDAEAMRYYPRPFSRAGVEEFIGRQLARYAATGHGLWAMLLKSGGEVIGDCGLAQQEVEDNFEIEVGYHLRSDQWHNGYATEAARACIEYGFEELGTPRVISMIRPENLPSRRVAERNGMTTVKQVFWHGYNHLIYATTKTRMGEMHER